MKDQMTITEYKIIDDITKVLKQTCETDHPYLVMLVQIYCCFNTGWI